MCGGGGLAPEYAQNIPRCYMPTLSNGRLKSETFSLMGCGGFKKYVKQKKENKEGERKNMLNHLYSQGIS